MDKMKKKETKILINKGKQKSKERKKQTKKWKTHTIAHKLRRKKKRENSNTYSILINRKKWKILFDLRVEVSNDDQNIIGIVFCMFFFLFFLYNFRNSWI